MEKYTIANRQEETLCDQCGYPLYVGDTAYEHGLHIFCSKTCKENFYKIHDVKNLPELKKKENLK